MIVHVVVWKLKDFAEGRTKTENAQIMKENLENLKNKIDQIRHIEIGINISNSEYAYDLLLYSEFDSIEDLADYRKHPDHLKEVEYIGKVVEKSAVVDYEKRIVATEVR
ncbi:MAG: Dabb family protein [Clostridiales bacterium]|nr:Dabb family protein [Clostridiales bacterium]